MKKELLIISTVFLASAIVFSAILSSKTPYESPSGLKECRNLIYNGADSINILLFADKKTAEKYSDYFYTIEPFANNKDAFNFYYIDYSPECKIYREKAILCNSEEVLKLAASCPNDYIAVLRKEPSTIRSSAFMNIMSLNYNHPKSVFLHEFGHVFANLADEYITSRSFPRGSENCVVDCGKFNGLNDDCEKGCTMGDYFRSINNGIMRTLSSEDYGNFDESLIQKKINTYVSFTGKAITEPLICEEQEYYLIKAVLKDGNVEILDASIEPGCASNYNSGDYSYTIITQDSKLTKNFNPEFIFTDEPDGIQMCGEVYESDEVFYLAVPVLDGSRAIEIEDPSGKIVGKLNFDDVGNRPCIK